MTLCVKAKLIRNREINKLPEEKKCFILQMNN